MHPLGVPYIGGIRGVPNDALPYGLPSTPMQFRIPTWYLLALVFALLTGRGRAVSIHLERLFIR